MFYVINKLVGAVLSPYGIAVLLLTIGLVFACLRRWKTTLSLLGTALVWLLVWALPGLSQLIGCYLEEAYPPQRAEEMPQADAIVLLGGGMSANLKKSPYPEMHLASDRVWHAARLYKAGKAPIIIPTGSGDRESTEPLLRDFGVPQSAIVGEYAARNTEENAKYVERLLRERVESGKLKVEGCKSKVESGELNVEGQSNNQVAQQFNDPSIQTFKHSNNPRILLVTSAWHMRRAVLMYRKYAPGLEIIPAGTDYEEVVNDYSWELWQYLPSGQALGRNTELAKELVGYWGYRLLRR